jgi:hypothetical protein
LSGHQYSHSQSSPTKPAQTRRFPALSEPRTCQTTFGDPPDPLAYLRKPVRPMSCPFHPTPLVHSSLFPMADAAYSVITYVLTSTVPHVSLHISGPDVFLFSIFWIST